MSGASTMGSEIYVSGLDGLTEHKDQGLSTFSGTLTVTITHVGLVDPISIKVSIRNVGGIADARKKAKESARSVLAMIGENLSE